MKVRDVLQFKNRGLHTIDADAALMDAVRLMKEVDIGSLVVMEYGTVAGILTFRQIVRALDSTNGNLGAMLVRTAMDDAPLTCTSETDLGEVSRMVIERNHTRYMPVMDNGQLVGVISLYDVARAVIRSHSFENRMLRELMNAGWTDEWKDATEPQTPPQQGQ